MLGANNSEGREMFFGFVFVQMATVCLTYAKEDLVDVSGGEVQQEEEEVDDKQEEAQNHTHPLLEALTWRRRRRKRRHCQCSSASDKHGADPSIHSPSQLVGG